MIKIIVVGIIAILVIIALLFMAFMVAVNLVYKMMHEEDDFNG